MESANRACYDALSAVYAGSLSKRKFERTADVCSKTSVVSADNADTLILLTSCNASSAEDALVVISYYGWRRSIDNEFILSTCIVFCVVNSVSLAESLEFAVCTSYAAEAVLIVIGQDQLESFTSVVLDLLSVGMCYHTVCARIYAGSYESSCSLYLAYAHSAGTYLIDVSQIAQCRYVDAGLVGCIQ